MWSWLHRLRTRSEKSLNAPVEIELGGCGRKPAHGRKLVKVYEPNMQDAKADLTILGKALQHSSKSNPVAYNKVFGRINDVSSGEINLLQAIWGIIPDLPEFSAIEGAALAIACRFTGESESFIRCCSPRQGYFLAEAYGLLVGWEQIHDAFLTNRNRGQTSDSPEPSSTSVAN